MRTGIWWVVFAAACSSAVGGGDGVVEDDEVPGPGWTGDFVTLFHETAGTVTYTDDETLRIDGFTFDGGGVNARLFLEIDGAAFSGAYELTDNLVGTVYEGEELVLDIPTDATPGSWDTITLWCIPFAADFGHATLSPPAE